MSKGKTLLLWRDLAGAGLLSVPSRRRRWRCGPLCLLLVVLLPAGCGRPTPEPTPQPVTLEYVTVGALTRSEDALFEQYRSVAPNVTVEAQNYGQFPAGYLSEPEPPDLMFITPGVFLVDAMETGLLTDLTDLWQQLGLEENYPTGLAQMSAQDGKQYFLPVGYSWTGLYYNRALFAELGLQPPTTWDAFLIAADVLQANDITPVALAGEDLWLTSFWFDYLNLRLNGPDFHRELMRGQASFADPRVWTVFDTWAELFARGVFARDAGSTDTLTALVSTVEGENGQILRQKSGMILANPNFLTELPVPLREQLDVVAFPRIDPSLPLGEIALATGFMAPVNAPHRDQALDFLAFVGGEAGSTVLSELAAEGDLVPAFNRALPDDAAPQTAQGIAILAQADDINMAFYFGVPLSVQAGLESALRQMLREVSSTGVFDVDAVVSRLEQAGG